MACLGEKVDRLNALQSITAAANQQGQVPGQGGGVATEVEQVGGGAFDDRLQGGGLQSLAGGIEKHRIAVNQVLSQALGHHSGLKGG